VCVGRRQGRRKLRIDFVQPQGLSLLAPRVLLLPDARVRIGLLVDRWFTLDRRRLQDDFPRQRRRSRVRRRRRLRHRRQLQQLALNLIERQTVVGNGRLLRLDLTR
jgi:hypothetical protein